MLIIGLGDALLVFHCILLFLFLSKNWRIPIDSNIDTAMFCMDLLLDLYTLWSPGNRHLYGFNYKSHTVVWTQATDK